MSLRAPGYTRAFLFGLLGMAFTYALVCGSRAALDYDPIVSGEAILGESGLGIFHLRRLGQVVHASLAPVNPSNESRVTEVLAAGSASYTDPAIPTALVLRQRVAELPTRQRTALILRFFVDLSVHETADLMGCEAHTVKKLTGRAIATLRLDPQLTDWLEDADVT
mgnify:CR=1 FL=1